MTTLRYGSRGEEVKTLQTKLGIKADGIFGKDTENAVRKFQTSHGLVADGIVGAKTWTALNAADKGDLNNANNPTDSSNNTNTNFISNMKILIDNGHGQDTAGKRSPDGRLLEYKWAREVATRIVDTLRKQGYDAERIVTEEKDISLSERVRRVNNICAKVGSKNCVLISVHINAAASDGKWKTASGWSGWVAPNASSNSKKLAKIIYDEAAKRGLKGNRAVPVEKYWVGDFTIIKKTNCPAVLTENLFQDNKDEVDFLLSEKGKQTIVDLHVDGLKKYIASL